jgi:hypothetical protein
MQCEYNNRHGIQCEEEAAAGSKYCVLHMPLPVNDKSEEFKKINKLKEEKVKEKLDNKDYDFQGAKLYNIDLSGKIIHEPLILEEAEIIGSAIFKGATLYNLVLFYGIRVGKSLTFDKVKLKMGGEFNESRIGQSVHFTDAQIDRSVDFVKAKIGNSVYFNNAKISGSIRFDNAEIGFRFILSGLETTNELSFKNTKFKKVEYQEKACRRAKSIFLGNREEADYHFFREMEARRLQKKAVWKILESPIHYIFGYGTRPYNVLATWVLVILGFGFLFWSLQGVVNANTSEIANSLWGNIYFSIVTATTLGYGDFQPKPGFFQILAAAEAIFGTFMWAAFIVIFARKYMR